MLNFSINRAVGKGVHAENQPDVKTIQHCLCEVKGKTKYGMKPLYQGKVDGKTGKKTVAAIMAFQEMEGLPITGKVDPHGQCISKLKAKTPNIVGKKIEQLAIGAPAIGQAAHTPMRREAKAHNQKLAAEIRTTWPLPNKQAQDIAACVEMVGSKLGVALEPDISGAATHSVKVDNSGIFTVDLKQKGTSGAAVSPHDRDNPVHAARDAMKNTMQEFAMPFPGRLTCRAKKAETLLANRGTGMDRLLMRLAGMSSQPKCSVLQAVGVALSTSLKKGETKTTSEISKVLKTIGNKSNDTEGKKLAKWVNDTSILGIYGISNDLYKDILENINIILPKAIKARDQLIEKSPKAIEEMSLYFNSSNINTADTIAKNLTAAINYLLKPPKSKFKNANVFDFDNSGCQKPAENSKRLAFFCELNETMYFHFDRIAFRMGDDLSENILHEVLHKYIIEKHQRQTDEGQKDPAYEGEKHFYNLPTPAALENPSSYVAFVRNFS